MSELAEYARMMHESYQKNNEVRPEPLPVAYPSKTEHLHDIQAVVFDIYGTMIRYWKDDFDASTSKMQVVTGAFRKIVDAFGMEKALVDVNKSDAPEKTLSDFYHGLITMHHDRARQKGVQLPEIRIEKVWEVIITILQRHGYDPVAHGCATLPEFSRKVAWTYNFHALGRGLYEGVADALSELRKKNMVLGLLSNAQFYTPVDLTLMLRDQSNGKIDDIYELFDVDLSFLSYEYLVAKPDTLLFRKLFDALYELQILPSQTVFVGNDLSTDIAPAAEAGMKTAFFTGDSNSAFIKDLEGKVLPDIVFTSWAELGTRLSFHAEASS